MTQRTMETTTKSGARRKARFATVAGILVLAGIGTGGPATPAWAKDQPATPVKDAGMAFEGARVMRDAERVAALEEAERLATQSARGAKSKDDEAAARYLSAEIMFDRGENARAAAEFRGVTDKLGKSPFADDAMFQSILATEATGADRDAMNAWNDWVNRFPESPLQGEAKLAQAWNCIRRNEAVAAQKHLTALLAGRPWYANDARATLARATVLYLTQKPADALALIGAKPGGGAAAAYLRGLCHRSLGAVLQSAASFQEVSDRYPNSPLRDVALLGKADAFLRAKDYRSAAEEFTRAATKAKDPAVVGEAEIRAAGATLLAGHADSALALFHGIVERRPGTDQAARAQFLIGDVLATRGQYQEAILELNRVLTTYFQHSVAASAQYRVARCLDALGRKADATGSYQAVVSGYPLEPEAPAAAYLA
ncbi:MAG TPA: tetratricopeptide repeat protein, partial [Candidatus Eisenbacteria bacterium]|nr:tetratricopeptide repeat protein [Candidatus Eisenbacteria bacterium]